MGLEIVSDGRGESWDWQAGHALASSQLPFMVGRGWNCRRRSAKADAALGHPNHDEYLWRRGDGRNGAGTLEGGRVGAGSARNRELRVVCKQLKTKQVIAD